MLVTNSYKYTTINNVSHFYDCFTVFVLGGDYSQAYLDVKDAQWMCIGDLHTADINQLTAREFVIYRYGVFIIKFLHQAIGTPEVTLLLATNLPQNNYKQNAFRSVFGFCC